MCAQCSRTASARVPSAIAPPASAPARSRGLGSSRRFAPAFAHGETPFRMTVFFKLSHDRQAGFRCGCFPFEERGSGACGRCRGLVTTAPLMAAESHPFIQECPTCAAQVDVSGEEPCATIQCPRCGGSMRVKRQFDHFDLLEQLGVGGMGDRKSVV